MTNNRDLLCGRIASKRQYIDTTPRSRPTLVLFTEPCNGFTVIAGYELTVYGNGDVSGVEGILEEMAHRRDQYIDFD